MVVEDDPTISEVVAYHLTKSGHAVTTAADGQTAIDQLRGGGFDLVILDLMLPRLSGTDVLRLLRRESSVPVIVLSARETDADQVAALELGADDYVTKPFSMRQLLARIDAVLRRTGTAVEPLDGAVRPTLTIDAERHEVRRHDQLIPLRPKEFELLLFLARNANRVSSRGAILSAVWGYAYEGDTRTVDVHIHALRRKIEDDAATPAHIVTVRQYGYKFVLRPHEGAFAVLSDA